MWGDNDTRGVNQRGRDDKRSANRADWPGRVGIVEFGDATSPRPSWSLLTCGDLTVMEVAALMVTLDLNAQLLENGQVRMTPRDPTMPKPRLDEVVAIMTRGMGEALAGQPRTLVLRQT